MADPLIRLTYEGGDADANTIDMRLLGLSLQGVDRITSDGLIVLLHQRPPKRRERAPLIAKVKEPVAGSYDFWGKLQESAWLLPLGYPVAQDLAGEFLRQWWVAVKARFSGKTDVAETAINAMVEMNRDHLIARDTSEARTHELQMAYLATLRETLSLQQRPLEQFVAPIGRSVSNGRITSGASAPVIIDTEEADEIRDMAELVWEPLTEIVLRTDGFKFHTSGLSIENPERTGFLMDPASYRHRIGSSGESLVLQLANQALPRLTRMRVT
jgi:hypothetical protein